MQPGRRASPAKGDQTRLLPEITDIAASTPDSGILLGRVADVLLRGADWVLADRLDEPDMITRVAARGLLLNNGGEAKGAAGRRSSAGSVGLLPRLESSPGRMLLLDAATLRHLTTHTDPHLAAQARNALSTGIDQLLLVGLTARDSLLGVLTLASTQAFDPAFVAELGDVASLVGLALDRARLLTLQNAVAEAMQSSLLPPLPAVSGLRLAARYVPAARGLNVGGDWYDAFSTASDLVLVIGDVRGHDLAAAARMADLRNVLRTHAVDGALPPSEVLTRTDTSMDLLGLDAQATVVVGRLSERVQGTWDLRWANAGHPPPVLLHEGRAELLETPPDLMLGVEPGTVRGQHVRVLTSGDQLLLYTDGLVENRKVPLSERLEQLRSTVEELAAAPDILADRLLSAFGHEPDDDIALLLIEFG
ncbi:MAG: hypothetical protein JWM40_521 [Frankiales bacterium]|nr:hypothetical protein [Frankiales bacterium]